MYGISYDRFNELAEAVAEIIMQHAFYFKISINDVFQQADALALNDAERLYIHFSIGTGLTKAALMKTDVIMQRISFKERAKHATVIPMGEA